MGIKLALRYFINKKKNTYTLLASIVVAVVLIFSVRVIFSSGFDSQIKETLDLNGNYDVFVNDVNKNVIDSIKSDSNIKNIYYTENLCYGVDKKSGVKICINSFDQGYINTFKYRFLGRKPVKKDEIVIEKEALSQMGKREFNDKSADELIGTEINLMLLNNINEDGIHKFYNESKKFKIVGIIEKPQKYYEQHRNSIAGIEARGFVLNDSSISIKPLSSFDSVIFLRNGQTNRFIGKMIDELKLDNETIYENIESSYLKSLKEHPTIKMDNLKNTILLLLVSTMVIYNIFSIILSEMLPEIGILRALGMKKKAIKLMLITYSLLFILVGTTLGIAFGVFVSYMSLKFIYEYNTVLSIGMENIIQSFFVSIVAISISSIILFSKILKLEIVDAIRNSKAKKDTKFRKALTGNSAILNLIKMNIFDDLVKSIITILAMTLVSTVFIVSLGKQEMNEKNSQLGIFSGVSGMSYGEVDKKIYGSDRASFDLFYSVDKSIIKKIDKMDEIENIDKCFNLKNSYILISKDRLSNDYKDELNRLKYDSSTEFPLYVRGYSDKMLVDRKRFIHEGNNILSEQKTGYINCILVNNAYSRLNHSFDTTVVKDLKVGDLLEVKIPHRENDGVVYKKEKIYVCGIMNKEYSASQDGNRGATRGAQVILKEEDYRRITGQSEYNTVFIKSTNSNLTKLDKTLNDITDKHSFTTIGGKGEEDKFVDNQQRFYNNINIIYQIITIGILLIQGIVVIRSKILVRYRELYILKNIGMSYKKMKRMFVFESELYCVSAFVVSSIIACTIHNVGILKLNNILKSAGYNRFIQYEIPLFQIAIIFVVFVLIGYISVVLSQSKLKNI